MASNNNKPVHKIRLGAIKAAIWENETENGKRHSVTVSKLYRAGEQWKETSSFGRDQLLTVAKVLDIAHTWIHETAQEETQEEA